MPKDKPQKEQIKVTDKRIFTPDGEIREEFRGEIRPSEVTARPTAVADDRPSPPPVPERDTQHREAPQPERRHEQTDHPHGERRRTLADKAENPGTPFANFIEPLIAQAYMSLGLLRNPYQPQTKIDAGAARQMIEILTLLQDKTRGNLDPDEDDFLSTHVGELKLAYVQRTKTI